MLVNIINRLKEKGSDNVVYTPAQASKLESDIKKYFDKTPEDEITLTGLILSLDMCKETFYNYSEKPEFKDIINKARLRIENSYELSLRKNGRTGDIFALKNFGWQDKQEIEANVKQTNITISLED